MIKICEWCKCEFKSQHRESRYCSPQCARIARRKLVFQKREARAKELGVTIEEADRMTRTGLYKYALEAKRLGLPVKEAWRLRYEALYAKTKALAAAAGIGIKEYIKRFGMSGKRRDLKSRDFKRQPKTYAEIKRHNRAHPIADGWRGQVVAGGWR